MFRALKQRVDFRLLVMGDPNFRIEGVDVEAYAWSKDRELETISRFDIGLYPLPDEEWVYGKSSLKAIQYMAMGIPTVATALGTNFRVIEDGVSGILVRTEDEWIEKIILLMNDPQLRERVGRNGRRQVEDKFSIKVNKEIYLRVLNDVSEKQ